MTSILDFSEEELANLRKVLDGEAEFEDVVNDALESKLYDYFSADMPYGVQKARTGDPINWIIDHLHELF